jgi:hypothetical protein
MHRFLCASAVNGKSLRFPPQATEKLRAFRHSTFIVLASLGKWYPFTDFCTRILGWRSN